MTSEILGYNIYVESNDAILRSDFMATATGNHVMEKENTGAGLSVTQPEDRFSTLNSLMRNIS